MMMVWSGLEWFGFNPVLPYIRRDLMSHALGNALWEWTTADVLAYLFSEKHGRLSPDNDMGRKLKEVLSEASITGRDLCNLEFWTDGPGLDSQPLPPPQPPGFLIWLSSLALICARSQARIPRLLRNMLSHFSHVLGINTPTQAQSRHISCIQNG